MTDKDTALNVTLAAATCTLLGATAAAPVAAEEVNRWDLDTALLYYGESDDRVQDVSFSVFASRDFDDDRRLNLDLSVDTLTGASPSGAIATNGAQTFTSPSGNAVYSTAAGEVPLDDTFKDTRVALAASWTQPFARLYTASAGASFSTEYDYTHMGVNFSLARDFNNRNTTVSTGIAYSQDDQDPVGGTPVPLSQMLDVGNLSNKGGNESKDVLDLLLGFTQVINRTTVLRVNYSFSDSSGYLNDPYKFLSVVDPVSGDTLTRSLAPGVSGPAGVYLFENRPDARTKHGLYGELKQYLGGKVLGVSYRFMTDDWGIDSHTLDGHMRFPLSESTFIEPHVRYYTQTAADFYRFSLVSGQPLPQFASADYRLSDFGAVTAGVKFGSETRRGHEWSVRLEYYQQSNNVGGDQLIGNQLNRETMSELKAIIAQFSYRFSL